MPARLLLFLRRGLLLLPVLIVAIALLHIHQRQDDPKQRPPGSAARLFSQLIDSKLATFDPVSYRIDLPAEDEGLLRVLLAKNGQSSSSAEDAEHARKLVRRLYGTNSGQTLIAEVAQWNAVHHFAAVRDNAPPDVTGASWSAWGHGTALPTTDDVPLSLGFVNLPIEGIPEGMGDWVAAAPHSVNGIIHLKREVTVSGKSDLTVQVVGTPTEVTVNGAKLAIDQYFKLRAPCRNGGEILGDLARILKKQWCSSDTAPSAYAMVRPLPLVQGVNKIEIALQPTSVPDDSVGGIRIRLDQGVLTWRDLKHNHRDTADVQLTLGDGTELTDGEGKATEAARNLDLVRVTGPGRSFTGSLIERLSQGLPSGESHQATLTIDTRWQKAATSALSAVPQREGRMASLVLMDAETGDILAVAERHGHVVPKHANSWDLLSFQQVYPELDPIQVRAWHGAGRHFTPGSTFKMVSGLAIAHAAAQGANVQEQVDGVSEGALTSSLGIQRRYEIAKSKDGKPEYGDDYGYYRPSLLEDLNVGRAYHNDKNGARVESLMQAFRTDPCSRGRARPHLGLCEAMAESFNIWFVRMMELIDGQSTYQFDKARSGLTDAQAASLAVPHTHFSTVLKVIGLDKADDPKQPRGDDLLPGLPLVDGISYRADSVASSLLAESAAKVKGRLLTHDLMFAAYGQGVAATPLAVARVAATVAQGKPIQPRLVSRLDGDDLPLREMTDKLELDSNVLKELRAGMKAVPAKGTAKSFFGANSPLTPFLWAKTGTANVASKDHPSQLEKYNTGWLAGWIDGQGQQFGPHKVAFACMVTHWEDYGSAACAPVIANLMRNYQPVLPDTAPQGKKSNAKKR
ncbi:penicillin-binding transpeptidase domain-containing protein [Magnetospirillum sp. 15-1]|uniref:penicillin-binding transpeptidase domain-containing protein n=1 Tax=Magnetospirillum sp. 15-1 TaxID=1979370 RepID=UPI000BBCE368|nr:penicillin-binding transpeptidase domain-containing protein [Magnetospirillum sp. 15-1]